MEFIKTFIAEFYLADYWIVLLGMAGLFTLIGFILCFLRKKMPLALFTWLSMSSVLLGIVGYIEKLRDDMNIAGYAELYDQLASMYKWLLIGVCAIIAANAISLLMGFIRRKVKK